MTALLGFGWSSLIAVSIAESMTEVDGAARLLIMIIIWSSGEMMRY